MKATTKRISSALGWLLALSSSVLGTANAFDYAPNVEGASQNLIDEATGIPGLRTIFVNDVTLVELDGIEWSPVEESNATDDDSSLLVWETAVNGVVQSKGTIDLADVNRELPTSIEVGSILVDKRQTSSISVTVYMEDSPESSTTSSSDYQTYRAGVSLLPLILILILAFTTRMVEISLFFGIMLGACIMTGSLNAGFKATLSEFILDAVADVGHVYVILFSLFLSGTVGMMQKSGGMLGLTREVSKVAKTPRAAQAACMAVGILIFFDDYANVLLAGETMRPILDLLSVSREKLSFIVDATAAPIASISPVSSWVGFEIGLVQDAIDTLSSRNLDTPLTIPDSGMAVFLRSLRYSYYSFFMLGLIAMLIFSQRDYGPMLVAERKVRVYDRTDGGPGKGKAEQLEGSENNQPEDDQPLLMHNMLIPIVILVFFIFYLLVQTGTDPSTDQTFMEKIESSDSYEALLLGTMATALLTIVFYLLQITIPGTGKLAWPTLSNLSDMIPWRKTLVEERGDQQPRFLLSFKDSVESFLYGMSRIFLAIVILCLAWASGSIMEAVGVDRLFTNWIVGGGIPYKALPLLTFLVALLIALATGTSWGTMAILYPLLLVPTYEASNGDPEIFYATTAAVMGGAVAGDHASPISDTTVLTALATDVSLMGHVSTQAPYVFWVVIFAVLFGYIPLGYGAYPNIVGLLLGFTAIGLFVYFVCVPVISPTGRWDIITMLFCGRSKQLKELSVDCVKKANGETLLDNDEGKKAESAAVEEAPPIQGSEAEEMAETVDA